MVAAALHVHMQPTEGGGQLPEPLHTQRRLPANDEHYKRYMTERHTAATISLVD